MQKIMFLQLFSSKQMGVEREKSLPQLSRDGISSVSPFHFISVLSMFQKQVSLTLMFLARIETRYVVLGFRPKSESVYQRKSVWEFLIFKRKKAFNL